MTERIFQISLYYGLDDNFRLRYGPRMTLMLLPCEAIRDLKLTVGLIDNNHLSLRRLALVPKDREPIVVNIPDTDETHTLSYPGKSAILCPAPEQCGQSLVQEIVTRGLMGMFDRRDHLHTSSVGAIKKAGWDVYWAPLQMSGKLLHARLVAQTTIDSGANPTDDDVTSLAQAFTKTV